MAKTFKEELNYYSNLLDNLVGSAKNNAAKLPNKNNLLDSVLEKLEKIRVYLVLVNNNGVNEITTDQVNELSPNISSCKEELDSLIELPIEGADALNTNIKNLRSFLDVDVVKNIERMNESKKNFVDSYANGSIEEDIKKQYQKIGYAGHPMSINDCQNLSIYNPDMDKTVDQLMWLSNMDYIRFRLYANGGSNVYTDALDKFVDELDKAPVDLQQKLAEKLLMQDIALRDACLNKFNSCLENCPKGKDPQEYAHVSLNESPEFLALSAFANLKSITFFSKNIMDYISGIGNANSKNPNIKNIADRPSTKMVDMANGDMNRFLESHNLGHSGQRLEGHELDTYLPTLEKNGFVLSKSLNNIIKENKKLLKDAGKSSDSMQAMRDTVSAFLDLNHGDPKSIPDYDAKLQAAIDAVETYKRTHKGHRFTDSGKERVRIANSLSESLASFKRDYEAQNNRSVSIEKFKGSDKALNYCLPHDVGDSLKQGVTSKEFVDAIALNDPKPKSDYQVEFNREKAKYNKEHPDAPIPDLAFEISENEKTEKELIHKLGLKNFAKATFDTGAVRSFIDVGIKYGEMQEADKKAFEERDLPTFLFEYGDDGKTVRTNIDRANKFLGKTLYKDDPKYQENLQKQQAAIVKERINHFKSIDYDKYINLSDKELAENYTQINKDCFPLGTMRASIQYLQKNNPYITKEMMDDAVTLINKYSNLNTYLPFRMNVIGSEYYSSVDDKKLTGLSFKAGLALQGFNTSDDGVQRFNSSIANLKNGEGVFFESLVNNKIAKTFNDSTKFGDVRYFDQEGNNIEKSDLFDKIKQGKIYSVTEGDTSTLRSFSYGGTGFEFKEEAVDLTLPVCDKIKAVSDNNIKELYSNFVASRADKPVSMSNIHSSLTDITKGITSLNYANKLTELGMEMNDDLVQVHDAIYAGKSLDEVKAMPSANDYLDKIGELYKAGRNDFYNKEFVASTVNRLLDRANYSEVDEDLLRQEAQNAGINVIPSKNSYKGRVLRDKSLGVIKDGVKRSVLTYSVSDRCYGIYLSKDGLTDDDKYQISSGSYNQEGKKQIVQNITDDILSEDFSNLNKLDVKKYTDNYEHLNYIRLASFDTSYTSKSEFKELFTPAERKEYETFCKAIADPINICESALTLNTSNGIKHIDINNVNVNDAVKCMNSSNKGNIEFWSAIVTNAYTQSNPEEMKEAMKAYDNLAMSRWTNTLLGKPGISKEEVEFINDCLKAEDPALGRTRLYEYAQAEFINAADGIEGAKNNPEKASYIRACASAGKILKNQMKRDGYEASKEQLDKLTTACDSMSKVKGDMSLALDKGRSLNKWALGRENAYAEIEANNLRDAENKQREAYKANILRNQNRFEKNLLESIKNGDQKKICEDASGYIYFKKLAQRVDKLTTNALGDALKEDKFAKTINQLKPTVDKYIETVTIDNLKELSNEKNFDSEFIKGFNFYAKQNSKEVKEELNPVVKESPEINLLPH